MGGEGTLGHGGWGMSGVGTLGHGGTVGMIIGY